MMLEGGANVDCDKRQDCILLRFIIRHFLVTKRIIKYNFIIHIIYCLN